MYEIIDEITFHKKKLQNIYYNKVIFEFFSRPTGSTAEATGSEIIRSSNPDHVGGFQVAMPIFDGIESKFGLMLPKFSHGIVNVAR